jgi:response regulator RpfG family c-di-GMP phosphodiesterase
MTANDRNRQMMELLYQFKLFRNEGNRHHVLQVQNLAEWILTILEQKNDGISFSEKEKQYISTAVLFHDIGKVAIPTSVLNKPGRLTKDEFEIVKTHAVAGEFILKQLLKGQDETLVQYACQIARWHHERYDGNGYPDGLKGDEIPIRVQVAALADVYDALTSRRVYKKAYPHEKAVKLILAGECGAFNPQLLDCVQELSDALKIQEMEKLRYYGYQSVKPQLMHQTCLITAS